MKTRTIIPRPLPIWHLPYLSYCKAGLTINSMVRRPFIISHAYTYHRLAALRQARREEEAHPLCLSFPFRFPPLRVHPMFAWELSLTKPTWPARFPGQGALFDASSRLLPATSQLTAQSVPTQCTAHSVQTQRTAHSVQTQRTAQDSTAYYTAPRGQTRRLEFSNLRSTRTQLFATQSTTRTQ